MNQIGLTSTFEKSLAKLTKQEQAMVKQLPTEFLFNPEMPGHRFHKLNTKENRFFLYFSEYEPTRDCFT